MVFRFPGLGVIQAFGPQANIQSATVRVKLLGQLFAPVNKKQ
jgi:hypothetical protein